MQLATIAHELLELERSNLTEPLSEDQQRRWDDLVTKFVTGLRTDGEKRRNLRIPGDIEIEITHGANSMWCTIHDISHFGMRVRGDFSKQFKKSGHVTLGRVRTEEGEHSLDLEATISWKRGRWAAGIRLESSAATGRQRYFRFAYYPLYLKYLKKLAMN